MITAMTPDQAVSSRLTKGSTAATYRQISRPERHRAIPCLTKMPPDGDHDDDNDKLLVLLTVKCTQNIYKSERYVAFFLQYDFFANVCCPREQISAAGT